ncbi:Trimethyllysine dioxygenase [Stereum hirsutum FP-91666 SS1]|uniref:Trimethyllysine dioxygenase n=1 Tax=Stereum hirsutum (strain FP-91666) TaxID=721885 RepID=UPI000440DDB0|nr:Trimethyllysine dioxygenase [Stereum hirsutum FP-91666 SS1]EIM91028.1 Trimethyllysine dioxygenase [Stereum hirsutum FP-91666 SS1]
MLALRTLSEMARASSFARALTAPTVRARQISTDRQSLVQKPFLTRPASSAVAIKQVSRPSPSAYSVDYERSPTSTADQHEVLIKWDDNQRSKYHHVWLRDHCRCPECFHPVTKQRLVNTFEIPPDIEPVSVRSNQQGLQITWPSPPQPHASFYPWSWLKANSYDPPALQSSRNEKILWGSKIAQGPPSVAYEEVMAPGGDGLYRWLSQIDRFGFCFVAGVPPTPEATEQLSTRIGFIRETHYGKFWDFTADLARGDTAYTNLALGAHTDNTYFSDPCGLQLFHLLSHTEGTGGATLLVDGFHVATTLRERHPELYRLLATVPVPAHAAGEEDSFYFDERPVLGVDGYTKELRSVRWNNDDRSVVKGVPRGKMLQWYDAIRTWNEGLTSSESEYWVQLTPGTVIAIDNHRVLHGRSAFTGKRRMCGAYIGMDEFRSKLAVLSERFDRKTRDAAHVHGGHRHGHGAVEGKGRSIWSSGL